MTQGSDASKGTRPEGPGSQTEQVRQLVSDGARLLSMRRPGEAAAKLVEARRLDPRNVPAAINLGGAYVLQGKFKQAALVLEAAAQLEPDNVMIWTNLAAAYLGKLPFASEEDQDRAIAAYTHALDLDARVPQVHYNLGLIYLERKDFRRAESHFHKALETDPNDRDARRYLEQLRRGEM
jgi:Flp pilus assembly protein TadD